MKKNFKLKKVASAVVAIGLSWTTSSQAMAGENYINDDGQTYSSAIYANTDVSIIDIHGNNITIAPLVNPNSSYYDDGIELSSTKYEPVTWKEISATTVFGNNLTVSTNGINSGIAVSSSNTGIFGDNLTIVSSINGEGWGVSGLEVNFGGKVQAGDNLHISVSGNNELGNQYNIFNTTLDTTSAKSVEIGDDAYLRSNAMGLKVSNEYSEDQTNISFGKNTKIDVKVDATTKNTYLTGVLMNVASNGKYRNGNQSVTFGENANVVVDAGIKNDAKGVVVGGANSFLIFGDNANIQVKAEGIYDEDAQVFKGGNASALEFSDDQGMSTWGIPQSQAEFKGSAVIVAEGTNQVTGFSSINASTLFHGDASISAINHGSDAETQDGGYTRAISLVKQDKVVFDGNANIYAEGKDTTGIYINDQYAVVNPWTGQTVNQSWDLENTSRSNEESTVTFNGNVVINAEKAIDLQKGGSVTSKVDTNGQLIGGGKYLINGDMFAAGDRDNNGVVSKIDLMMTNNSVFTGAAHAEGSNSIQSAAGKSGVIKLDLNNSRWNMTEDSSITSLKSNNGTVDFIPNTEFKTLTVENLSGNGTFKMNTDIVSSANVQLTGPVSDKLIVTNSDSGKHNVIVTNQGSDNTTGKEVLTLIETASGQAEFGMAQKTELGGYVYDLRQAGNNWELYSSGKSTSSADASANFLNVGYLLNYAETQTLLQRMGELRQDDREGGDVWARTFTGKFNSFGGAQLSGFDMDYTGIQAGVDKRFNFIDADIYLGMMGGTSKANPNYKEGDGDVTGYHVGFYGSYVMPNNFYVDTVVKYSHFKNNFNVKDTQYNQVNGSASTGGYALSVEAGKRFYLDQSREGFYLEPQAQLSYGHQGSTSTTASNGLKVEMDSYDSTLARVSGIVGYEVKSGKNPINIYAKTGYVKEMSGDVGYRLNGNQEKYDFGGDWWENGVGVNAQFNKKHSLYLDGTYSTGSKFDQTQINAGYRYVF